MMKFAMNYSVEAKQLVDQGIIDIDMFKCPDFDQQLIRDAQEARHAYVHFALYAGQKIPMRLIGQSSMIYSRRQKHLL
ncbi:hypothetical protein CV093_19595 [Oceanobacillus sp. 143]|nr:hypothetical protein CV093_19595 [Oceanobacillus sp. 143]